MADEEEQVEEQVEQELVESESQPTETQETVADETPEQSGEPETTTATTQDFSDSVLSLAQQMGMSEEEARGFGSESALVHAMNLSASRAVYDQQRRAADEMARAAHEQEPKFSPFAIDEQKLVEAGLTPEAINVVKGINDHYHQTVTQLNDKLMKSTEQLRRLDALERGMQEQSVQKLKDQFDDWINGPGKEFEAFLGKGRETDLDPNSPEFKARLDLLGEVDGWKAQHNPKAWEKAAMAVFGKRLLESQKEQARKEVTQQVHKQNGKMVHRPTGRMGDKVPSGDEAALASIGRYWKDD